MEITVYAHAKLKYEKERRRTGRHVQDQDQRGVDYVCNMKKNEEAETQVKTKRN